MRWLLIAVALATLGACGKADRPPFTDHSQPAVSGNEQEPPELARAHLEKWRSSAKEAARRVAFLEGKLEEAKKVEGQLADQERQEARRRWVLWLTIVSLLGTVGCAVAAWFLPVGRKTLIGAAVGLACVPLLIRMLNLVETWAFWLMPMLIIGGASIYLLPQIKKRLHEVKP